jgi:hypothetical protein
VRTTLPHTGLLNPNRLQTSSIMRKPTESFSARQRLKTSCAHAILVAALISGCSTKQKPIAEAPPQASPPPIEQLPKIPTLPPPQPLEVQDAVKRIFADAVVIDTSHKPAFMVADFNGDQSEDIAVVLLPVSERLPELNEESPTWLLRVPSGSNESKGPRLRVANNESLLAVIHGYGLKGWRDAEATQTYLLKNAVGSAMRLSGEKEFAAANHGKSLPRLRGAVVAEVLNGKPGYLYYADAAYAWYDPQTFKAEPERRMGHARAPEPPKK